MSITAAPAIAAPETAATVNIAVLLLLSPVAGATVPDAALFPADDLTTRFTCLTSPDTESIV